MPGYTYTFVDNVPPKCVCPLCKLPMQKPVQINICNHSFCESCLQNQLNPHDARTIKTQCPLDDVYFDFEEVNDNSLDQAIIDSSMVKCPQEPFGCPWVDMVKHVSIHVKECKYVSEPCPQNCGLLVTKIQVQEHLNNCCTKNKKLCAHCQRLFRLEDFENHENYCPEEVIWCENKCGQKIRRQREERHLSAECLKREVKCPFCMKAFAYDTLQTHTQSCSLRSMHTSGTHASDYSFSGNSSLEKPKPLIRPERRQEIIPPTTTVNGLSSHFPPPAPLTEYKRSRSIEDALDTSTMEILCPLKAYGCPYKGARKHVDDHMRRETSNHLSMLCDVIRNQKREIDTLRRQLKNLPLVNNGNMIWRIDGYKEKLKQSQEYKDLEFCSVSFYTSRPGYRLQASVFLNGNGTAQGRYLSLYAKLLPGEFDPIVDWPFVCPVRLTLLDQSNDIKEHVTESFKPDPTWKHFQRPTKENAAYGFGYPRLISHEALNNRDYIKNDTMFLQVEVLAKED